MTDETGQPGGPPAGSEPAAIDPVPGAENRPMSFMERARLAAQQAAKIGGEVGREAAKIGGEVGHQAAVTIKDPATQARAKSALNKAKRGFTTALERIDPKILADVVIKATSLQERANASLKERGSVYRIGEIGIGASIPPSITFTIERVDDPNAPGLVDSSTLLAEIEASGAAPETIVTLDGTAIDDEAIEEAAKEA
jgi:hypothetical protein